MKNKLWISKPGSDRSAGTDTVIKAHSPFESLSSRCLSPRLGHFRKLIFIALILGMILPVASCGSADSASPPAHGDYARAMTADSAPPPAEPRLQTDSAQDESIFEAPALRSGDVLYGMTVPDATRQATEAQTPTDTSGEAPGQPAEAQPPDSAAPDDATGDTPPPANEPAPQTPTALGVDLMQRMIIRSSDIAINTLYYQSTISGIESAVANRGGFIENSRQWMAHCQAAGTMLWRAQYVIRVPVGLFDTANSELLALGQVRYFSTTSHDATHEFNDLGSRLQIREAEETRVARMLEEATELSDIINLEARLTNLRLVIDAYRRRREEIDHLATFSTIHLSVYEVMEFPEVEEEEEDEEDEYPVLLAYGFGQRIGGAFSTSANVTAQALEAVAVFLAAIILPVGLLSAFLLLVYLVAKKLIGSKGLLSRPKS